MRIVVSILVIGLCSVSLGAPDPTAAPAPPPPTPKLVGRVSGHVVVVDGGKPASPQPDSWVYLQRQSKLRRAPAPLKVAIRQKGLQFTPRVQVIPLRSVVEFPNDDDQEHNVFSPSGERFDLNRYRRGVTKDHEFAGELEYDIYCDIHRDMFAKVKVVDSDYIARVVDGAFTIDNVAPGTYKLRAWTPDTPQEAVADETIAISAGSTVTLAHPVHLKAGSPHPHRRKDGSHYPHYNK